MAEKNKRVLEKLLVFRYEVRAVTRHILVSLQDIPINKYMELSLNPLD